MPGRTAGSPASPAPSPVARMVSRRVRGDGGAASTSRGAEVSMQSMRTPRCRPRSQGPRPGGQGRRNWGMPPDHYIGRIIKKLSHNAAKRLTLPSQRRGVGCAVLQGNMRPNRTLGIVDPMPVRRLRSYPARPIRLGPTAAPRPRRWWCPASLRVVLHPDVHVHRPGAALRRGGLHDLYADWPAVQRAGWCLSSGRSLPMSH